MNQKELIEKLEGQKLYVGSVSDADSLAMRDAAYSVFGVLFACNSTRDFVLVAAKTWPDLPLIIALRPDQRKAMMRMTEPHSEMYLKLRAAQLYQRVCWLNSQEKKQNP